jgi:hypothetical protein
MSSIGAIQILTEASLSFGASIVDGLLAWCGVLGVSLMFFAVLAVAGSRCVPGKSVSLARCIDRALGVGFVVGIGGGFSWFIIFLTKIAS